MDIFINVKITAPYCPTTTPMRQQSRQPDWGPVGRIKGYSHGIFTQEGKLKSSPWLD
jgi:hypothetical protein